EGDLARAGALLEQAARIYESTGHDARAAQMRRHVDRLGPVAHAGARGVEEPPAGRPGGEQEPSLAEALPGDDRELFERAPTLADPALEAWCSFCCRPSREVGALVAGPSHAYVCRQCVGLAASLLDGADRSGPEGPLATPGRAEVGLPATARLRAFDSARVTPVPGPGRTVSRLAFATEDSGRSPGPRRSGARPEPLSTQAEAVARIEAALTAGHARVLLVGAAGSGKSTWLHTWAARGLGTAWDGTLPIPEHGPLLVDDVDGLEPSARRQLARVLPSRPVVLALDATLPEPEHQVGGRRVHAPEQVESLAGTWLPGPVLDGLTLECFRAPGEGELRLLAERWRAPDGSPAQPDALEEALRLSVRSARAAHALHALLLRWWASR
ncbi:MAG TPA: ClpX C4-type zinc finger protein, partial [Myxococcaceae bacterium]|nr:ClpX C4-type zinc finger protein [Myxococcaceae bacterium]